MAVSLDTLELRYAMLEPGESGVTIENCAKIWSLSP